MCALEHADPEPGVFERLVRPDPHLVEQRASAVGREQGAVEAANLYKDMVDQNYCRNPDGRQPGGRLNILSIPFARVQCT